LQEVESQTRVVQPSEGALPLALAEFVKFIEDVTRIARELQELNNAFGQSSPHDRTSPSCSSEGWGEKPVFKLFITLSGSRLASRAV
jgi:hypothetical protein